MVVKLFLDLPDSIRASHVRIGDFESDTSTFRNLGAYWAPSNSEASFSAVYTFSGQHIIPIHVSPIRELHYNMAILFNYLASWLYVFPIFLYPFFPR